MVGTLDEIRIDHVTFAGRELSRMADAFAGIGIEPEYGGGHDSLPTHMSIVGFDDGTYIELIAKREPTEPSPYWDEAIDGDAGPCAWAIRADELDRTVDRLRRAGIEVDGPRSFGRDRPDGTTAEWKLAFLGDGEPGELLPFLIEDVTPRSSRVRPTPSASGSELEGIETVVIAVEDLDRATEAVRLAFDLPKPDRAAVETGPFAGTTALFDEFPAVLLAPAPGSGVIADRLERFGTGPCAFLLATSDTDAATDRFGSLQPCSLGSRTVHVVDPDHIGGLAYLGIEQV